MVKRKVQVKRSCKRPGIPALRKKAWDWFSKYIRLRDCLITTGKKNVGRCFTCGVVKDFKNLQAGHFIDGRGKSVLFVEEIVHAQCTACNMFKGGNKDAYTPKMIDIYGLKKVEEFWALKRKLEEPWTRDELEEIAKYYKEEYENALKNN